MYQHFASKEALYAAVLETKAGVEEILAKAADAAARKESLYGRRGNAFSLRTPGWSV